MEDLKSSEGVEFTGEKGDSRRSSKSYSKSDSDQKLNSDDELKEDDILEYLDNLGLSREPNCLVLTPSQHYYYNEEDLRTINTLVNLKQLNLIKNLEGFLHNLYRILPPDASFIGCFSEMRLLRKTGTHHDKNTKLLNWFRNFLGIRHGFSRNEVNELLETHGFRIVEMKEIYGLTFFISRNVRKQACQDPARMVK